MFKLSYAVLFSLALTAIASPLAPRSCSDVTVYFARGTGESGTIGTTVGPQFKAALKTALGSKTLEFVGVPYPANIWGFLEGGDPGGSTTMANYVKAKASSCPSTKIVLSGYSQGAQVAHNAAAKLSTTVQNRVKAAVLFGDPKNGQAFPGSIKTRVKTFCAAGDFICTGGVLVTPAHTGYAANAKAAASFVVLHV